METELSHKSSFGGPSTLQASSPPESTSVPNVTDRLRRAPRPEATGLGTLPSGRSRPRTSPGGAESRTTHSRGAERMAPDNQSAEPNSVESHLPSPARQIPSGTPVSVRRTSGGALSRNQRQGRPRMSADSQLHLNTTSDSGGGSMEASKGSVTDASYSSIRAPGLSTSNRLTAPKLPMASVRPAPPPAMYWSRAPVHGSVPKRGFRAHTATMTEETMWLFGGCDAKGCFNSLWCFDVETMCWSKPKVTGEIPSPRRAHSATMVDRRLFVFGGGDGPQYYNELYVFDTVALKWSKPEVVGANPPPRRAHSANEWNGNVVVFGGGNGVGALNDAWVLELRDPDKPEWREISCSGKLPIGRGYHTGNVVDGKLIVIGGSDGHMSFNDIFVLHLDEAMWYQVKTDEVHNRLGHTSTQVGSYLFIFGGHDSSGYTNEIITLNLVNLQWESRRVCGKRPAGRGYHQAWLRDSRLFLHGGFDGKDIFDDLHFLDLAACSYLPQITQFNIVLEGDSEEQTRAHADAENVNAGKSDGEQQTLSAHSQGSRRPQSTSGTIGEGGRSSVSPNKAAAAEDLQLSQQLERQKLTDDVFLDDSLDV